MATGIEFLLQINAEYDEATKMVRVLQQVDMGVNKANASLTKIQRSTGVLDRVMGKAGGAMKGFAQNTLSHFTALASFQGLAAIGRGLVGLGESAIMAAAGAERTARSFKLMWGARAGGDMLEGLGKVSKVLEFDDDQLNKAAQQLKASGFKDARIWESIAGAADVAAKMKTGAAGFDSVIGAITQMHALQRAPRALGNFGLPEGAGKLIEKEMGRGTDAVGAFLMTMQKAQNAPLGTFGLERGKDLDVKLGKLQGLPDQFFQQLAGTTGFEKLKGSLSGLLEAFDPDGPRGKRIFAGLEKMIGQIGDLVAKVNVDAIADGLLKVFTLLPPLIEGSTKALVELGKVISGLTGVFGEARGPGGRKLAMDPSAPMTRTQAAFVGTIRPMTGLSKEQEADIYGFQNKVKRFFGFGTDAADGLAKGLDAGVPKALGAAEKLANSTALATQNALDIRSPSRVFAMLGVQTAAGFALGLERGIPSIEAAADSTFSPEIMPSGPSVAMGAMVGGGGGASVTNTTFNLELHVNAAGAGNAQEIAQTVAISVRHALEQALEQRALDVGNL